MAQVPSTENNTNIYDIKFINRNYNADIDLLEGFDNDENVVYNIDPSELSEQGKKTLEHVRSVLFDHEKLFFVGEKKTEGEFDKNGPLETCWNLYVIAISRDGSFINHQFCRYFHWHHDSDVKMDDVPYEKVSISDVDFSKKVFCF